MHLSIIFSITLHWIDWILSTQCFKIIFSALFYHNYAIVIYVQDTWGKFQMFFKFHLNNVSFGPYELYNACFLRHTGTKIWNVFWYFNNQLGWFHLWLKYHWSCSEMWVIVQLLVLLNQFGVTDIIKYIMKSTILTILLCTRDMIE